MVAQRLRAAEQRPQRRRSGRRWSALTALAAGVQAAGRGRWTARQDVKLPGKVEYNSLGMYSQSFFSVIPFSRLCNGAMGEGGGGMDLKVKGKVL